MGSNLKMKEVFSMAEYVGKSKFEIMVDIMKALNVSSFDVREVEKCLKKFKAQPDENGGYSEEISKAVVDHFKLEKEVAKSDKAMVTVLKKQVKDLTTENQQLRDQLTALTTVKSMVEEIGKNLGKLNDDTKIMAQKIEEEWDETTTDSSVSADQLDDYPVNDYNNAVESSSQQ